MKILALIFAALLAVSAFAQQPPSQQRQRPAPAPAPQPSSTPTSTEPEPPAATRQMTQEQQMPARESERETATRPTTQPAPAEQRGGATNANFHFDMKETAPNVTHHQITANGRTLH